MRILVNGLPFFSRKLVQDLNEFDAENSYIFCDTYTSKWAQIKWALLMPFAGAVISSKGVTSRSKSLDLALKFKKKLIMQWHGTDVKFATEKHNDQTIDRKYIDHAVHLVSAPWFTSELKGIVDVFAYAPFGYVNDCGNNKNYKDVSILTYLAEGREEFYGWKQIAAFARKHPEISISVVGSTGEQFKPIDNLSFLGWVSEIELHKLMREHAIFLRLTEHDGKSISVSEALGFGCEVIWSYELEHCHYVQKTDDLERIILDVKQLVLNRDLKPNQQNITYAKEKLNKKSVMTNFATMLKKALNE